MSTGDRTSSSPPPGPRTAGRAADRRLDIELDQTFPASDAIPWIHETPRRVLHLEDFTVGRKFVSGAVRVEEDDIKSFARRFDPQPFHLDAEAARDSAFGGLVASGWHTAAMTMRLLVGSELKIAGGLIGLGGEVTWPRATRPGDTLTVESEVLEITPSRSKPDRGVITVRTRTLNQAGEPVQITMMKLLVPRRSGT